MVIFAAYSTLEANGSSAAVHSPFAMESPSFLQRNTQDSMPMTNPIVLPMMRAHIKLCVKANASA